MRLALGVEYNGQQYFGWQKQKEVRSVQSELEKALERIAQQEIHVVCAGRTDAGVHATQQVVHFDTDAIRPERAWTLGVNTHLPDDIAVRWVAEVDESFNARFSAVARRYRYVIYNAPYKPAILSGGLTHIYHELNAQSMHEAAQCLLGENDFSAFRAAQCQSNSPNRNVHHVQVERLGDYIMVDIQANAFVHHMVRNIVGSLSVIGSGEQPVEWMQYVLEQRDRTLAAATAKPNGLYLVDVIYPETIQLPKAPIGPLFLSEWRIDKPNVSA